MEILVGVILYLLVIALFVAFGKFLKNGDDSMLKEMMNEAKNRSQRRFPVHDPF